MAFGTSDFGFSKPASSKKKRRPKPKPKPKRRPKKQKTPWWAQGGGGLLGGSSPWGNGPPKSAAAWDRERMASDKRKKDAEDRAANKKKYAGVQARISGMSVIPESYTRAQMKKDIEAAQRKARKNNPKKDKKVTPTSSAGGGGGSSSSGGAKTSSTTGTDSKYNEPVEQEQLDWEKMYAPARKQIENMRAEVARRRKVDEDNWAAYKTWAEGMATKTASELAANNKATNDAVTANNAAAIESINKYVDQARTSMGTSGSLGMATGAGSMSADAAASAAAAGVDGQLIGDAQTSANTMADAIAAQNQYNISMTKANFDQTHNQAAFDIDTKSSEIDQAIAAAKLDKFYKDRQYNLDLEAAEWLRGYKDRSLNANIDQANQSAALTRLGLDVKAANTAQEAEAASAQTRASAFKDVQARKTSGDLKDFGSKDSGEQGQLMKQVAIDMLYKYKNSLSNTMLIELMSTTFGGRFDNVPSAKRDLAELLKEFNLGVPGPKSWPLEGINKGDKYNQEG